MKTKTTSVEQISAKKSAKIAKRSVKDSASLTTECSTSKTRNFGWLVTGMVEACQEISADNAIEERQ